MTAVQETVSRISIVTQRGLTSVIGDTYGKKVRQASGFYAVIVASLAVGHSYFWVDCYRAYGNERRNFGGSYDYG